jgi:hypothetical protein
MKSLGILLLAISVGFAAIWFTVEFVDRMRTWPWN